MTQTLFDPLPLLLFIPLLMAVISWLVRHRWATRLSLMGSLVQLLLCALLWYQPATQQLILGGWQPPLGIALQADGAATLLMMVTAWIQTAIFVYASRYPGLAYKGRFWPLCWFVWGSLNLLWCATDIFNIYVGLEMLGLAAVGLVALSGETRALAAALRYLLATLLGSLAWLLGVALLYGSYGTLALDGLAAQAEPGLTTSVAVALMLTGLALKTAIFPLHAWLPAAHGSAITPVSALLSALVIKGSFFVMLRLWMAMGHALPGTGAGLVLGLLGAGALLWGSLMALRQERLKMVIAWSTVAQTGYLCLFFPLITSSVGEAQMLAMQATLYQILAHGLAKAALFLAAGNLIIATGRDRVDALTGTGRFMPLTVLSFAIASVSLMGLPPSAGFIAKWLMGQSALIAGLWGWVPVLLMGSLLSAAYLFRVLRENFREGPQRDHFEHPPRRLEIAAFVLAMLALMMGLTAAAPLARMGGLS